ncbi:Predicted lipoprotein [Roseivivax halotolerans]|uniref:Predicted lipoprotein n=1 Tax=Roseivivax halotolerans TaxID=93684 RepID=A0A1I5ZN38_9RHOB|nr:imelysin family protein [Roseivivax halotolerans]SFQ57906.1 Predicted lipoprotein [Roseivivax halotolerans]
MRLLTLTLCLVPTLGVAQSRFTPEEARILQKGLTVTAEEFILPAYRAQEEAAARLTSALGAYCGGDGALDEVRDGYADLFLAWQRAGLVKLGPVTEAEGPMRVQLWPDPKGFSRRAVLAARNDEDPAMLEEGALEGRSIALVNLTALEDLVQSDLTPGSYYCDLARAIADYQDDLAQGFVDEWTPGAPFRDAFDSASDGNDTYGSVDDLIREFLSGLVVSTDRIRKNKIARGLGAEPGETYPERTEAVAIGLGLESIRASFSGLADLYEVPGGFFQMTPEAGGLMDHYMHGQTARSVAETLQGETRSLVEIAEADGEMAATLRRYGELLVFQEAYLKAGLAESLGLTAGFSAADGD